VHQGQATIGHAERATSQNLLGESSVHEGSF
jgi:hypothetical protein